MLPNTPQEKNLLDFLGRLYEKTRLGLLTWEESSQEGEYRLLLKSGPVLLSAWDMRDERFMLKLLNTAYQEIVKIDSYKFSESPVQRELRRLYVLVRQQDRAAVLTRFDAVVLAHLKELA